MNLLFRLIRILIASIWSFRKHGATLLVPDGISQVRMRCWPNDIDTNLHMNNGRYLTLMDLGRTDWVIRSGLLSTVIKENWAPMLSDAQIHFRREIKPFQTFTLETRIAHWDKARIIIEQRFVVEDKDGTQHVAAFALVRAGMYDRKAKQFVLAERMMAAIDSSNAEPPEHSPEAAAFSRASDLFKLAARAHASIQIKPLDHSDDDDPQLKAS